MITCYIHFNKAVKKKNAKNRLPGEVSDHETEIWHLSHEVEQKRR